MSRYQLPVHSPLPFRALASGIAAVSGTAAAGQRLERYIEEKYGPRAFVRTDSGTSALRLALSAVKEWRPELPVALPAYSCYDLATAAEGADVQVVLYDLDPGTLGPDPESVRTLVKRGISALVLVHLYGIPVDLDEVRALLGESGALMVEDAAQGVGGAYGERPLGSLGPVSILSFGRGKGLTGVGGGAVLAHDSVGAELLEVVRDRLSPAKMGWSRAVTALGQWALARPGLYRLPASVPGLELGETVYHDPWPPAHQSRFTAGVLDVTVELETDESRLRREVAENLRSQLEKSEHFDVIAPSESSTAGYLRLPALCRRAADEWIDSSSAFRLGVMEGYPNPLVEVEAIRRRCVNSEQSFPGAEALARRLVTFPAHSLLSNRDKRDLIALIETGSTSDRISSVVLAS